jgi:TnpA family transposase
MISDQYSHPYIQIIPPHMREAHAALDAMLHHETELPIEEMMVDTAGFTELMYALYDLQGFKLSPRIRDLVVNDLRHERILPSDVSTCPPI